MNFIVKEEISRASWLVKSISTLVVGGVLMAAPAVYADDWSHEKCDVVMKDLATKTEESYVAYALKLKKDAAFKVSYDKHKAAMLEKSKNVSHVTCYNVLREYVDWFSDEHIFILDNPKFTDTQKQGFVEKSFLSDIKPVSFAALETSQSDAIEGLWFTKDYDINVLPANKQRTSFVAVIENSRSDKWNVGEKIAHFEKTATDQYATVLVRDDKTPQHNVAKLTKGGLFVHMPPYTWGKLNPSKESEKGLLASDNPRHPTFKKLNEKIGVLSIPSFSYGYYQTLNTLVEEHTQALTSLETLIIDIRGNSGGSSVLGKPLMPFVYGEKKPSDGSSGLAYDNPVLLSSPLTIAYADLMGTWAPTVPDWTIKLKARMEASPGEIVNMFDEDDEEADGFFGADEKPETVYENPMNVALLWDNSVISAGEAVILALKDFSKVTTFGEPSNGTIDYQNVYMTSLVDRQGGYLLGLPMIAGSDKLPTGGYNETGIVPEVLIDLKTKDPIAEIVKYYQK